MAKTFRRNRFTSISKKSERDGRFNHHAASCRNHGGCNYCRKNRQFKFREKHTHEEIMDEAENAIAQESIFFDYGENDEGYCYCHEEVCGCHDWCDYCDYDMFCPDHDIVIPKSANGVLTFGEAIPQSINIKAATK